MADESLFTDNLVAPDSFENVFIAISGLIGAGKSTLAKALGNVLELPVYYESVKDNPYLADFYENPAKHGFALQIYLLNERFRQHQQITWQGRGGVQDRSIWEDSVFARMLRDAGLMHPREYDTYRTLFGNLTNLMRRPTVLVYLDVTPEEALRRIKMRGRKVEANMELGYLQNLHVAYQGFLKEICHVVPVIKVDYNKFHTAEAMAQAIKTEYAKLRNIREVKLE